MLKREPIINTIYYILAGPDEGTRITRNNTGVVNQETLSDDQWFIIQTNEDHFSTEENPDGICNQRC